MRKLSQALPLIVGAIVAAAFIVGALRWQARERDAAEPARLAPRRGAAKEPARPGADTDALLVKVAAEPVPQALREALLDGAGPSYHEERTCPWCGGLP